MLSAFNQKPSQLPQQRQTLHMCSYSRACSTISGGAEKIFTGVRLATFCSRAICCMASMICWECLTPTFTAWQKSCCSTFSADASSITSKKQVARQTKPTCDGDYDSVTLKSKASQFISEMHSSWLTHLTAGSSSHNEVESAGGHLCPGGVDQQLPINQTNTHSTCFNMNKHTVTSYIDRKPDGGVTVK